MLVLLLASGALALVQGWIIGDVELDDPRDEYRITVSEATELGPVIWIDARKPDVYRSGHYPGAIHLSEDDWDAGLNRILSVWDFQQSMVVYCDGGDCASSREIASRLREDVGTRAVFWLQDGWQALKEISE